jgi:hypothetical protein
MDFGELLSRIPLWGIFVLTLALCLGAVEIGAAYSRAALRKSDKDPEAPLGSLVGSLLGLLAFTLALTFSMAAARFDTRKQLVLDESNAIGTTYLRAGLLPPKEGLAIRALLREYTALRASVSKENAAEVSRRSEQIHGLLWAQTKQLALEPMDSEIRSLFILSLNETIDLHQSRKTIGLQRRIPGSIWAVLYLLTTLSMLAVGYQVGMSGVRRLRGAPVLAAAFSLVFLLIADLDRPGEGFLHVSQQPLIDVQHSMAGDSP